MIMRISGPDIRSDTRTSSNGGVCWITGASSGIGRSLALRMAAHGWTVAVSARRDLELRELAAEAPEGRIVPIPLDTTDATSVAAAVARIERDTGPIAIAVLNAGTHIPVHVSGLSIEPFQKLIDVNLMGTVACLVPVAAAMRRRGCGRIAIVASVAGYRGLPTAAAYGMTKAGLINLAESLAPELAKSGVRLQIVNPGFVRTPLTDRNAFPMPFLMAPDAAADALFRGLSSTRFEIVFPLFFAFLMKLFRLLPYPLAFAIARRVAPKE